MAKLRHIAMSVSDVASTARFYEEVFGMTLVRESSIGTMLTDGVISLAIMNNNAEVFSGTEGLHHFGFVVDDPLETQQAIETRGGVYVDDEASLAIRQQARGWLQDGRLNPEVADRVQLKFHDPNGVHIDVVSTEYGRRHWRIPD